MQAKHTDAKEKESGMLPALLLLVAMILVLADPVPALELISQLR